MQVFQSSLEMVGKTPMLQLHHFDTGLCQLFLKLEHNNPGGSIKDRIALHMIECAEKAGKLKPGYTLVEATAGNTGLGLALIAKLKGYKLLIVIPDKMGKEKVAHLRAMGAQVITTRSDVEKGHPEYYQDFAESLASKLENSFYVNQFNNEDNPDTHEKYTGPEIWEQMNHKIDAFVYGMGSTGTMTGVGRFLKKISPKTELILADPKGSILAEVVNRGAFLPPGKWMVEGIGEDFIPTICDLGMIDKAYYVSDKESFFAARELLLREGVLAGSSTGTHLHAALKYCQEQTEAKRVVTVACDTGNKYLTKQFSDEWMWIQGFLDRPVFGDLRDYVLRPFTTGLATTLNPKEPLATAHKHMLTQGFAQIPVIEKKRLVGLLTENALLDHLLKHENLSSSVESIMEKNIPELNAEASRENLIALLQHHPAIAITWENEFFGLITKMDFIHACYRHLKMTEKA